MIAEAELVRTAHSLVPKGQGWFLLDTREIQWWERKGRGVLCVAVGAHTRSTGPDWGAYTVDDAALRHGACVERETTDPHEAYARFPSGELTRYRDDWLPA